MPHSIKLQKIIVAIFIATYSLAMTIASGVAMLILLSAGFVVAIVVLCLPLAAGISGLIVSASAVGFNVPYSEKTYWMHLICSLVVFGFAALMLKLTYLFGFIFLTIGQAGGTVPYFQGVLLPYAAGLLLFVLAPVYLAYLRNQEQSA